jgi:hypothetical protein
MKIETTDAEVLAVGGCSGYCAVIRVVAGLSIVFAFVEGCPPDTRSPEQSTPTRKLSLGSQGKDVRALFVLGLGKVFGGFGLYLRDERAARTSGMTMALDTFARFGASPGAVQLTAFGERAWLVESEPAPSRPPGGTERWCRAHCS